MLAFLPPWTLLSRRNPDSKFSVRRYRFSFQNVNFCFYGRVEESQLATMSIKANLAENHAAINARVIAWELSTLHATCSAFGSHAIIVQ